MTESGADYRACGEERPGVGGWHCNLPYGHVGPHFAAIDGYYTWDPEPGELLDECSECKGIGYLVIREAAPKRVGTRVPCPACATR